LWRLRHNTAGQPIVGGVVDGQRGLHASEPLTARSERRDGAPELIRFRQILGIEDGRE